MLVKRFKTHRGWKSIWPGTDRSGDRPTKPESRYPALNGSKVLKLFFLLYCHQIKVTVYFIILCGLLYDCKLSMVSEFGKPLPNQSLLRQLDFSFYYKRGVLPVLIELIKHRPGSGLRTRYLTWHKLFHPHHSIIQTLCHEETTCLLCVA